jgi:hypothetical protein
MARFFEAAVLTFFWPLGAALAFGAANGGLRPTAN